MRILYINKTFSGPMEQLARFIAQKRGVATVFMAERWLRDEHVPGMMRVRIPVASLPDMPDSKGREPERAVETLLLRNTRNAANVQNLCLRLQKGGFVPDIIYATTQDGYAQDVGAVFPNAKRIARVDGFYHQPPPAKSNDDDGVVSPVPLPAFARLHNVAQIMVLSESDLGITSSHWQKNLFVKGIEEKIHVIAHGVDTRFFKPDAARDAVQHTAEYVTFTCQGAYYLDTICQCLPDLLTLRPQCRVRLMSFASRRAEEAKVRYAEELAAHIPHLSEEARQRVEIIVSPPLEEYLRLLQSSTVYVHLTPTGMFSTGLLEAMSCGGLVLASDTEPVREVITLGENGLLWPIGASAQSLAAELARILANASQTQHLQNHARETILARHDIRTLLQRHAALVLD